MNVHVLRGGPAGACVGLLAAAAYATWSGGACCDNNMSSANCFLWSLGKRVPRPLLQSPGELRQGVLGDRLVAVLDSPGNISISSGEAGERWHPLAVAEPDGVWASLKLRSWFGGPRFQSIACVAKELWALDTTGALYRCVVDGDGDALAELKLRPVPCNGLKIDKLCASRNSMAVVASNGVVLCKGQNGSGQLGLGHKNSLDEFAEVPRHIFASDKVVDVAFGQEHGVFLSASGSVYTCGSDAKLQLGVGHAFAPRDHREELLPRKITPDVLRHRRAIAIAAGDNHSLVLAKNDTSDTTCVISWGAGQAGQLGHGNFKQVDIPRELKSLSARLEFSETLQRNVPNNVRSIAAYGERSLAVFGSGAVFAWGALSDKASSRQAEPLLLKSLATHFHADISSVSCTQTQILFVSTLSNTDTVAA